MTPKPQPLSFSPVPQASITHFPESYRRQLEEVFDVSADRISSCTVTHDTTKLFNVILLYAALCPNVIDPEVSRQVFVNHVDPYFAPGDNEDREWLPLSRQESSLSMASHITHSSGARRRKASRAKLHMDIGSTVVHWPPPKHLVPQFLILNGIHDPYKLPDGMGGSITLHIMHYEVGPPLNTFESGVTSLHFVRVSTDQGDEALQQFLNGILQWRCDQSSPDHQGRKYNLYRFKADRCGSGEWAEEGARRARPHDSVVLADGQMDAIMEDVEQFLHPDSKSWYIVHGLPYRRSYLFEGVPGTGKTSTIRVLAGKYSLACCFLSMTNEKFSNQLIGDALSGLPSNALLVLEDVDALFKEDRSSTNSSSLTFSGLLNALDGMTSSEGLITIMTTNHADRLDPALIRGGRVDRRFCFAPPSEKQLGILLKLFYKEANDEVVKQFVESIARWGENHEAPTTATLQQLFIRYRGRSVETCVAAVPEFLSESAAHAAAVEKRSKKRTEVEERKEKESKEKMSSSIHQATKSCNC